MPRKTKEEKLEEQKQLQEKKDAELAARIEKARQAYPQRLIDLLSMALLHGPPKIVTSVALGLNVKPRFIFTVYESGEYGSYIDQGYYLPLHYSPTNEGEFLDLDRALNDLEWDINEKIKADEAEQHLKDIREAAKQKLTTEELEALGIDT